MKYATYQSYKFSGTDWIGEIPSNWECRRLKDCGALLAGAGFPHEYQGLEDEELPFYKVGDLSQSLDGRNMASGEHTISRKTAYTLRAKVIPPSAIVYAKIGAALLLNRRRITVKDCCIDNNMTAFIPNQRRVSTAWAHYWLSTLDFGEFTNPGAVPSLSEGYQATLPITLPPLDEQQTIARFLDAKTAQIDALVAQKRQLIDKLKERRQALIARTVTRGLPPEAAKAAGLEPNPEMKPCYQGWADECPVHWQTWKISHGFGLTGSGTTPPSDNEEWYEGDIPWVTTGELRESIITDTSKKVSRAAIKEFTALKIFPVGSLAIAMYGATIGRLGIFGVAATTNQACCVLAKERAFERDFVFYWLQAFRDQIVMLATGGGQPNISQEKIRSLRISCPSVHEQQIISKYLQEELDKIDQLVDAAESAIKQINELRQALITSAVTGKINVRELA